MMMMPPPHHVCIYMCLCLSVIGSLTSTSSGPPSNIPFALKHTERKRKTVVTGIDRVSRSRCRLTRTHTTEGTQIAARRMTTISILLRALYPQPPLLFLLPSYLRSPPYSTHNPLHYLPRSSSSVSTTDGSASVDVSPSCSSSLAAIFRSTRRIIFPLLVFGSPGAQ